MAFIFIIFLGSSLCSNSADYFKKPALALPRALQFIDFAKEEKFKDWDDDKIEALRQKHIKSYYENNIQLAVADEKTVAISFNDVMMPIMSHE